MVVSFFLCTFVPEKMKRLLLTILISYLALLTISGEEADSLVMNRLFDYKENYTHDINGFSTNVYIKHLYQVQKRNIGIWAIPSMYTIAHGQREFVSEVYGRFVFNDVDDYEKKEQVYYTTIPRNRRTMTVLWDYLMPNLYDVTLYKDHVLSPFCRENRGYYRYNTVPLSNHQVRLYFRPRLVRNTQLVRGKAIIDERTGRIEQVEMEGEFDMIKFQTISMMGDDGGHSLLPKICQTSVSFKFGGNHVTSQYEAVFDCPITLPDTVYVKGDRNYIDSIRPISLSKDELKVYEDYDRRHGLIEEPEEEPEEEDTLVATMAWVKEEEESEEKTERRRNYLKEIGWDLIGENLLHSQSTRSEKYYFKSSAILDPQYISFSKSKGISYKMKFGAEYRLSENSRIVSNPYIGYNFKFHDFYYYVPIRWLYDTKRNGSVQLTFGNDNRIGSSVILDEIKREYGDSIEKEYKDLNLYDDHYIRLFHHIAPLKWLRVEAGAVFHQRTAVNADGMRYFGKATKYYSLAPSLSLNLNPWEKAPVFTIDYERGLRLGNTYMNYERWELDASVKYRLKRTQQINGRLGGGLYTAKSNDMFMDFANFRDNNLPDGWDDDWSGSFQLLNSSLYNASKYYIRGNISYESPLIGAYLVPLLGRYVERERFYLSTLSIEHSRLYSELGFGFTCRVFSMGVFTSFLNTEYQDIGCKFTFELFRRW